MRLVIIGLLFFTFSLFAAPEFKGDIRYRMDRMDHEGNDVRLRHRIRGRIQMTGTLSDKLSYGFRLVSGDNEAPTSTTTTFDNSFSSKNIYFDRIYVAYKLLDSVDLLAGKIANPFYRPGKNHMLFDGDISPEGIALDYHSDFFFIKLAHFIVEERSSGSDTTMIGTQMGLDSKMGGLGLKVGLGYYGYMALQGHKPLYYTSTPDGKGNSLDGANNYLYDYDIAQLFFSLNYGGLEVFGDALKNIACGDEALGWLVGMSYSNDSWVGFYNYRRLEANAVIGAFADSDFAGGGTDNKGHAFGVGYHFAKYSRISLTHFITKTALDGGVDYQRTYLDYKLFF